MWGGAPSCRFLWEMRTAVHGGSLPVLTFRVVTWRRLGASHSPFLLPRADHWRRAAQSSEETFLPPPPQERFKSEGGRVFCWGPRFTALKETKLGAALIELEPNGLVLPKYTDSPTVVYVVNGCAHAGLITPMGIRTNVRKIHAGQMWVIPKGWAHWICNSNSKDKFLAFAVTDMSSGPCPGNYTTFFLAGSGPQEKFGGILHGFSKDLLAHAWDVEKDDVEQLLKGQGGAGIIKVQNPEAAIQALEADAEGNGFFSDYTHEMRWTAPDWEVKGAGCMVVVNKLKLPVLGCTNFAVFHVSLLPGAMKAPHWSDAPEVMYVTEGKGKIEMTYPGGKQALSKELKPGDLVVIPALFPHAEKACDDDKFKWVTVVGCHSPKIAFLAGANSVYKAMPPELLEAAFGVEKELSQKFRSRRTDAKEICIFPPKKSVLAM